MERLFPGIKSNSTEEFKKVWDSLTLRCHPFVSYKGCIIDLSVIFKALKEEGVELSEEAATELRNIKVQTSFLLPEDQKALSRLKQRFRSLPEKYEIEHESRLIPRVLWDDMMDEAQPIIDEFEARIADIGENWEIRKAHLEQSLDEVFRSIGIDSVKAAEITKNVLSHYNDETRRDFMKYHGMKMQDSDYDPEELAVKSVVSCLNDGFRACCNAVRTYNEIGMIKGGSVRKLTEWSSLMEKTNDALFKNDALSEMVALVKAAMGDVDLDTRESLLEEAIVGAAVYAEDAGIALEIALIPFSEAAFAAAKKLKRDQMGL